MADILLTNDDGYRSPGFYPLLKELSKTNRVVAVCPDKQKSWVGKSITSSKIVILKKQKLGDFEVNTLTGTPADCVQIGIFNILKKKPDLVVSGINEGPNIDIGRIWSSGTIAAGIEAYLQGVSSVCISYVYPKNIKNPNFDMPAQIAYKIIEEYYGRYKLLSINIPYKADLTTPRIFTDKIQRKTYKQLFFETDKNSFIFKKPTNIFETPEKDSDVDYLSKGLITLTSLTSIELNL